MVLLSFDIEEFDMPFEYGGEISFEEQLEISRRGLIEILALLAKHKAKATFFSTVVFAENNKDLIVQLLEEGHELASHTWFHSKFSIEDLKSSREKLAEMFATNVTGLRMPRMKKVDCKDVQAAGYTYNSSVNPTFLPGKYNNLRVSRTYFREGKLLQIPASVSPLLRIPLFWLSFHNFPLSVYKFLSRRVLKKDQYLNIYFHPWEFADIKNKELKLPGFTTKNSGRQMVERFDQYLMWLNKNGYSFGTFRDFETKVNA